MNADDRAALAREWDNLSAGWRRAEARRQAALAAGHADVAGEAAGCVVDYGRGLRNFVTLRGLWHEGRELLTAGVAAARQVGDKVGESLLLFDLAWLVNNQGNPQTARDLYGQSLAIHEKRGDTRNQAATLHELGRLDAAAGDAAGARARYEESLRLKRQTGDMWRAAATLHELGILAYNDGDDAAARDLFEQSLALERAIGDREGGAIILDWLGFMAGAGRGQPADRLAKMRYWTAAYLLLEPMGHPEAQKFRRWCEVQPDYADLRAAGAFDQVLAELWGV